MVHRSLPNSLPPPRLSSLSSPLRDAFKRQLLHENCRRLRILAYVGSCVNILIIVISVLSGESNHGFSVELAIRGAWIVASFGYILLLHPLPSSEKLTLRHGLLFYGAASLSMLFSGILTSLLSVQNSYTFLYVINSILTGAFLFFRMREILLLMVPTWFVLVISFLIRPSASLANPDVFINVIAISAFAIAIASATYRSRLSLFLSEEALRASNQALTAMAEEDELTQLPNRRKFEEVYRRDWEHAWRNGEEISLIMMDIDFFKNFNDTYGHLEGDQCLRRVAGLLKSTLSRGTDFICRYGGEEFIALLPATGPENAEHLARHIQRELDNAAYPHRESPFEHVTLSMGIATLVPSVSHKNGTDPSALIEEADAAMYKSKRKGRNQISFGTLP